MREKEFASASIVEAIGHVSVVRRREFLGLVGGAVILPGIGWAQQSRPAIGLLLSGSSSRTSGQISAFWQGLSQAGFEENRNVAAIYAWSDGHDERLPGLVLNLLNRGVSIIVAGGAASVVAARQSTDRTPIVFVAASVPAGSGFDLNRSDGNITGVSVASPDVLAERFRTLLKIDPVARTVAVLVNPQAPNIDVQLGYLNDAAKERGIRAEVTHASDEAGLVAALENIARSPHDAFLVANDGFLNSYHARLVALATSNRIPAAFANREFVEDGGLLSYGPSFVAAYQQAGGYVARILKGERPSDLPIGNPFEMELALNAKTARLLGLDISPGLLAAASEVIR